MRKICGRIKVLIYVLAVNFVNTMWWSCGFGGKEWMYSPCDALEMAGWTKIRENVRDPWEVVASPVFLMITLGMIL